MCNYHYLLIGVPEEVNQQSIQTSLKHLNTLVSPLMIIAWLNLTQTKMREKKFVCKGVKGMEKYSEESLSARLFCSVVQAMKLS